MYIVIYTRGRKRIYGQMLILWQEALKIWQARIYTWLDDDNYLERKKLPYPSTFVVKNIFIHIPLVKGKYTIVHTSL